MSPFSTRIRRGALTVCGLAILLGSAVAAQSPTPATETSPAEGADPIDPIVPIRAALAIIEQHYREPVSREQLVAGALEGMVRELDPYSEYLDENEWREFHSSLRAEFAGIGVQLAMDTAGTRPVIAQALLGSPAKAAGLRAGDLLLAVDGQSTEGLGMDRVRQLLRGAIDTPVDVSVLHAGSASRSRSPSSGA